jgi:hypothetical protein
MNRTRGQLSILHGHYGGSCTARADAIASGIYTWQTRFEIRIHLDESFFSF